MGRGNSASQKVIPPNSEAQVRYYPLHTGSMISVRLRTGSPSPLSPSGVQVQLREVPTCISTSCLIILPSAHLSAARASPKSMGTRSCREAKGGTPSPPLLKEVLADTGIRTLAQTLTVPLAHPPPSLSYNAQNRRHNQTVNL